ncbi:hypothetical protein JTB14_010260 [Gonioctena quinquepunctata]|nr:hypothetical protein JTB14_010260 [Gonioctena quinquepunctata]
MKFLAAEIVLSVNIPLQERNGDLVPHLTSQVSDPVCIKLKQQPQRAWRRSVGRNGVIDGKKIIDLMNSYVGIRYDEALHYYLNKFGLLSFYKEHLMHEASQWKIKASKIPSVEEADAIIIEAYQGSMSTKTPDKKLPYWWNTDIEMKRNECLHSRRLLTRLNRRTALTDEKTLATLRRDYRTLQKNSKE